MSAYARYDCLAANYDTLRVTVSGFAATFPDRGRHGECPPLTARQASPPPIPPCPLPSNQRFEGARKRREHGDSRIVPDEALMLRKTNPLLCGLSASSVGCAATFPDRGRHGECPPLTARQASPPPIPPCPLPSNQRFEGARKRREHGDSRIVPDEALMLRKTNPLLCGLSASSVGVAATFPDRGRQKKASNARPARFYRSSSS